uniref:cystathionine gamma-lyase n=1 Tax=Ditylenchus dipsaci TaxID=166011 RepID=A0A915EMC7_9BILA
MVWFESPSNPLMKLVDMEKMVKVVRKYGDDIIIVIDSTFMSPFFQNPISKGVDVVVHSVTKYINGHNDVMMGAVMTDSKEIDEHLLEQQRSIGSVPSAFDCYLVNRGVKTLHLRMERHHLNGLAVARFLENHTAVEKVHR